MAIGLHTDFALLPPGGLPHPLSKRAITALGGLRRRDCTGSDMLGWLCLPDQPESLLDEIEAEARRISALCDLVVVVGVGGSSLGAQAALDFVASPYYNQLTKTRPQVLFSGDHIDGDTLCDLLTLSAERRLGICLVSKSGTTVEPSLTFRALEHHLFTRYGPDAARRILCICGDGPLSDYTRHKGYTRFAIPEDVGGRYSTLSPAGLVPMALCGLDIRGALKGAKAARQAYLDPEGALTLPARYAALRQLLADQGRPVEVMAMFSPALGAFGNWLQQLFAESEGKNGGGILPLPAAYTADLHALGQFVQQGNPIVFETMLTLSRARYDCRVAPGGGFDGLNALVGQPLDDLCRLAVEAVARAHSEAGVPVLHISAPGRDAEVFGWLVMFFQMSCAVGALMAGINPFDQPGVEDYKAHMRRLFGGLI